MFYLTLCSFVSFTLDVGILLSTCNLPAQNRCKKSAIQSEWALPVISKHKNKFTQSVLLIVILYLSIYGDFLCLCGFHTFDYGWVKPSHGMVGERRFVAKPSFNRLVLIPSMYVWLKSPDLLNDS